MIFLALCTVFLANQIDVQCLSHPVFVLGQTLGIIFGAFIAILKITYLTQPHLDGWPLLILALWLYVKQTTFCAGAALTILSVTLSTCYIITTGSGFRLGMRIYWYHVLGFVIVLFGVIAMIQFFHIEAWCNNGSASSGSWIGSILNNFSTGRLMPRSNFSNPRNLTSKTSLQGGNICQQYSVLAADAMTNGNIDAARTYMAQSDACLNIQNAWLKASHNINVTFAKTDYEQLLTLSNAAAHGLQKVTEIIAEPIACHMAEAAFKAAAEFAKKALFLNFICYVNNVY